MLVTYFVISSFFSSRIVDGKGSKIPLEKLPLDLLHLLVKDYIVLLTLTTYNLTAIPPTLKSL